MSQRKNREEGVGAIGGDHGSDESTELRNLVIKRDSMVMY